MSPRGDLLFSGGRSPKNVIRFWATRVEKRPSSGCSKHGASKRHLWDVDVMETPVALNVDDNDEQGGRDIFLGANR